jgi:hypothetical protein
VLLTVTGRERNAGREDLTRRLEQYLAECAAAAFPEFPGPVRVTLRRRESRAFTTLYEFALAAGAIERRVLVKVPGISARPDTGRQPGAATVAARPRRFPPADPASRVRQECLVLNEMHRYFGLLGDQRFAAIRPVGHLDDVGAFLMEMCPEPSLSRLMLGARVPGARAALLRRACRHAGAWLRAWHRHPGLAHTATRNTSRDEFIEGIRELTRYVGGIDGRAGWMDEVGEQVAASALRTLPPELPSGVFHGDFAPRNVLAGIDGRVTVIDTAARWRTPIYADLAYFLFSVDAARPQVYTGGLMFGKSTVDAWRAEFLRGYFEDDPIPAGAIALFEVDALLDRWAAEAARVATAGANKGGNRWRFRAWDRYLAARLRDRLRDLS